VLNRSDEYWDQADYTSGSNKLPTEFIFVQALTPPALWLHYPRVRVFAPALGGAAYTCKDLADSLAGKDRYEFEIFFAPRTVLTVSESVFRFIDTRQMIPV